MISFIQEKNFLLRVFFILLNCVNWHLQKSTENILLHVSSFLMYFFFLQDNFSPNQVLVVISFIHTRTSRLKDKNALLTGYNYFSFTFLCLIKNTEKNSQMEKELWSKSFTLSGLCLNDSYILHKCTQSSLLPPDRFCFFIIIN